MSLATEEVRARSLFECIEMLESVAATFDDDDERQGTLRHAASSLLALMEPVRVEIAARIMNMSDKTVRAWTHQGVLVPAVEEPRLLLDPIRLHEVLHVVNDLRATGRDRHLLDLVWPRLNEQHSAWPSTKEP